MFYYLKLLIFLVIYFFLATVAMTLIELFLKINQLPANHQISFSTLRFFNSLLMVSNCFFFF